MYTATAALTAFTLLFGYLPSSTGRASDTAVAVSTTAAISEGHYTDDDGRVVTYVLWLEDDELQAEVSIVDPNSTDTLEMWLVGEHLRFEGVYERTPFSGTEPASNFFDIETNPDAPVCGGWVVLVCIGAAAIIYLSGGCSSLSGCSPTEPTEIPGGGGGNPGGGDGDDGDD